MLVYVKTKIGDVDKFNQYVETKYEIKDEFGSYKGIEIQTMEELHKFVSDMPRVLDAGKKITPRLCPFDEDFILRFE